MSLRFRKPRPGAILLSLLLLLGVGHKLDAEGYRNFSLPCLAPLLDEGVLIDRWGSPFRFHPISGSLMEFSSCGPDTIFGKPADITLGEDDS